ncbi:MAG: hypothetical protein AAF488_18780, partial [Planctomycetota bacterium]
PGCSIGTAMYPKSISGTTYPRSAPALTANPPPGRREARREQAEFFDSHMQVVLDLPELAKELNDIWVQRSQGPNFPEVSRAVYARWRGGEPLDWRLLETAQRRYVSSSWASLYGVYGLPRFLWVVQNIGRDAAPLRPVVEEIRDRTQSLSEWRAAKKALERLGNAAGR